ncbi:hypothetical protein ACLOJK_034640 [Asimina triloba]
MAMIFTTNIVVMSVAAVNVHFNDFSENHRFKKNQLKVEIDRTGTKIAVSGEKWVQEMIMVGWQMRKKDPQISRFRRVFQIPDGILVDRIKARFDEFDSILTVFMPKSKKGIEGIQIKDISREEEQQQQQEVIGTITATEAMDELEMGRKEDMKQPEQNQETSEKECKELKEMQDLEVPLPIEKGPTIPEVVSHDRAAAAASAKKSEESQETYPAESKVGEEKEEQPQDHPVGAEPSRPSSEMVAASIEHGQDGKPVREIEETEGDNEGKTGVHEADSSNIAAGAEEKVEALQGVEEGKRNTDSASRSGGRSRRRFCKPRCLIAGSTIILSLVAAVFQLLKSRRNQRAILERRD